MLIMNCDVCKIQRKAEITWMGHLVYLVTSLGLLIPSAEPCSWTNNIGGELLAELLNFSSNKHHAYFDTTVTRWS